MRIKMFYRYSYLRIKMQQFFLMTYNISLYNN